MMTNNKFSARPAVTALNFTMQTFFSCRILFSVAALFSIAGCASLNTEMPQGTGGESEHATENRKPQPNAEDFDSVAIGIANRILAVSEIKNATRPPLIILTPSMDAYGIPIEKTAFQTRLRASLEHSSSGKARFVVRGSSLDHEQSRSRRVPSEHVENGSFESADYFLTATFTPLVYGSGNTSNDRTLFSYQLLEARTGEMVWMDSAELAISSF